jgi:fructoselysine-6-P-deglycase FrlB-like protein
MLLRASLGDAIEPVAEQAGRVLDDGAPLPPDIESAEQITFLGHGWAYGVALEAALKLRESAQLWTEAYPQMEYRHGPIAIAEPGRAVWVFGQPVAGLAADIAATGAALVGPNGPDLDPVADLVRVHLLALRRAERKGLDPDHPRHLTRSVVLD